MEAPKVIYGFCIGAQFECDSVFGKCIPQDAERGYASDVHVVGFEVDLDMLLHGYVPKYIQEYGRVMWQTLGIKCTWYPPGQFGDVDDAKMITPLEFVKSWMKDWTRQQCEDAIKKINACSEDDTEDAGVEKYKKCDDTEDQQVTSCSEDDPEDAEFEKYKNYDYLCHDGEDVVEWSLDEKRAEYYVPFSPEKLEEYINSGEA